MKKLNDIPNSSPFKVPDNYFEEVNRKIISGTTGTDQEIRKVSFTHRFRTSLLIAASVAGIILFSYTAIKLFVPAKTNLQLSEVRNEINQDAFLNEIDISSLEEDASMLMSADEVPDVSKSDIIDYLLSENIEINDIYEQL